MSKSSKIALFLIDNIIWIILVLLVIINIFITPKFFTYGNILNIFYHSSVLSMLVLAEGLILLLGYMDLSIESILAFAPAIAILSLTRWSPGIGSITAIIITFTVGALIGLFNGVMITKFNINPFLQTLSMLIVLRGIVLYLLPESIFGFGGAYSFLGSKRMFLNVPMAMLVMLGVFLLFHFILSKTVFGRQLIATGGNPQASFISGINTQRIVITAFVLSGVLASLAGLISTGRQNAVTNAMGEGMVFMAFAGAILGGVSLKGGVGKVSGMLGGVLLLGVIDNSLNLLGINIFLIYATKGIIIFVAIVLDQTKIKLRSYIFHREDLRKYRMSDEVSGYEVSLD